MTVKEFVDLYKNDEEVSLDVIEYIPFQMKMDLCEMIINKTTYTPEFRINSPMRNMMYRMVLINSYLDIDVDYENILDEYDVLEASGGYDYLISFIPEIEVIRFDEMMQQMLNDLYENERSIAAIKGGK